MPVYNQEDWIRESLESILRQSYSNLEVIIINDGSTDGTESVIQSFNDSRICYFKHERNEGLVASLNEGLRFCKGAFIARMDGDDVALPDRIELQVKYLIRHSTVDLVGSYVSTFSENCDATKELLRYPVRGGVIKWSAIKSSPFAHPSVLFRRKLVEAGDFYYDASFFPAEDYELWCRLSLRYKMANIPQALLKYRVHEMQVSAFRKSEQSLQKIRIREAHINGLFPKNTTDQNRVLARYFVGSRLLLKEKIVALAILSRYFFENAFSKDRFSYGIFFLNLLLRKLRSGVAQTKRAFIS